MRLAERYPNGIGTRNRFQNPRPPQPEGDLIFGWTQLSKVTGIPPSRIRAFVAYRGFPQPIASTLRGIGIWSREQVLAYVPEKRQHPNDGFKIMRDLRSKPVGEIYGRQSDNGARPG